MREYREYKRKLWQKRLDETEKDITFMKSLLWDNEYFEEDLETIIKEKIERFEKFTEECKRKLENYD